MHGPLEGLVVIDASQVMPGSIASVLLADHGADVVKVEPKGGNFFSHDLSRKGWERGKRSVELDIADESDRESLRALIATADVFIHSLEERDARRLELDRATLAADHPALIVCALTAYGQDTPFAGRPYGESLAGALLGTMVNKSSPFRKGPVYLGYPSIHYGQAFIAVINILAALRARRENGTGQDVEATLMDAYLSQSPMNNWWQEDGLSYIANKGDMGSADRFGHTRLVTGMFECGDGVYIQMHTGGEGAFKRTMDLLGFGDRIQVVHGPEMAVKLDDDEYHAARVEVFDAFRAKSGAEWIRLFHEQDIAALPVLSPAQVLLDEQVEFVGMCLEMQDADYGTICQAAPAIRYLGNPPDKPMPAPRVGEHNTALNTLIERPKPVVRARSSRKILHPLEGLRILDLSSFFACGYAARLMSDLGADVIKVETPGGDQMRPLPDCFAAAARGKRDVVIDLKCPEGAEALNRLVLTADVLMHNLRPGKAEKLGLGYDSLAKINPKLIYAYLPGFGSKGPKANLKSFAPLVSGWTGLLYEGAGEGNPPTNSVFGNEDYNNGFLGAVGVLMAIEARYHTGKGDYLECPQLHSSLFTTSEHFLDADKAVVYGMRMDKEQRGFNALDSLYRTKDGWVCISCRDDKRFAALAVSINRPELASDARFLNPRVRSANDATLREILIPLFAGLTSQQAFTTLDSAGAPVEIPSAGSWIQDDFLVSDWALASNRVLEDVNSIYGHIREIGLMGKLSETPGQIKGSTPRLGEHTRPILLEVGYTAGQIDDMIARRVVVDSPIGVPYKGIRTKEQFI